MIITLTTDFGLTDPFVGIMKGVILGIAPAVQIVDLTHDIHSHDVMETAVVLLGSFRFFPPGTIHVVVTDPGVGSSRRALAAAAEGHLFVAPDNGALSYVLESTAEPSRLRVHHIQNETLFLQPLSQTFHGRDIFAPVAAHLANGRHLDSVGPRIFDFVSQELPVPRWHRDAAFLATVLRVDKFGNAITNIRAEQLPANFTIRIGNRTIQRLLPSYAAARPGEFFVIEGSTGFLELARNLGNAAEELGIVRGAEIEVETGRANH